MEMATAGLTLIAVGVALAESEHLIIPIAITLVGILLLRIGAKEFDDEE